VSIAKTGIIRPQRIRKRRRINWVSKNIAPFAGPILSTKKPSSLLMNAGQ
jgi:hypothetical protein